MDAILVYLHLSEEVTVKRHLRDMEDIPAQDSQGKEVAYAYTDSRGWGDHCKGKQRCRM